MAVETENGHVTCSKVAVELPSGSGKTPNLSKILNDPIIKMILNMVFLF